MGGMTREERIATDDKLIEVLRRCSVIEPYNRPCSTCPYRAHFGCISAVTRDCLALILRYKEENERLKAAQR